MSFWPTVIKDKKQFDLPSLLLEDRIIMMITDFNNESCAALVAQLLHLDNINNEEITIYINSPGGSVHDGLAILDTMKIIESPVHTVNIGLCASMGAVLLSHGDKRSALPNAQTMIHQVSAGTRGHINDMEKSFEHSKRLNGVLMGILAKNMRISLNKLKKIAERDLWLNAEEALELKVIDHVIQPIKKR